MSKEFREIEYFAVELWQTKLNSAILHRQPVILLFGFLIRYVIQIFSERRGELYILSDAKVYDLQSEYDKVLSTSERHSNISSPPPPHKHTQTHSHKFIEIHTVFSFLPPTEHTVDQGWANFLVRGPFQINFGPFEPHF
jgi:hypothetical protein